MSFEIKFSRFVALSENSTQYWLEKDRKNNRTRQSDCEYVIGFLKKNSVSLWRISYDDLVKNEEMAEFWRRIGQDVSNPC